LTKATTANIRHYWGLKNIASTFVLYFASAQTLIIYLSTNHQLLSINLTSVSGADTATIPPLRQAVPLAEMLFDHPKF
jgi:hypothetical protein